MTIKNNAIFIADAHYNSNRDELFTLLQKVESKEIEVTQIFFMGDIFDFLCGGVNHFYTINEKLIKLINTLSLHIETIYFEGNHDYNLEEIFPKINIIPRELQPSYTHMNKTKVALSHGDIFTPKGYNIYCAIIRNRFLLSFLNKIDFNNWLSKIIESKLKQKHICRPMENFSEFVDKRVALYNSDLIIEGHFHQGHQETRYINVPSLACSNQYMIYQDEQFKFITI